MDKRPIHPIERNRYLIFTKSIDRVVCSLMSWIRLNFPGAMVYGHRRRGKSRCIKFIKKHLAATLGYPIAVVVLCARRDRVHEGDFLDDIMDALHIPAPSRLSKAKKMEKIRTRLLLLARRCPTWKVVFIVDDAQRLNGMNYDVLMSLFNELEEQYEVHLFVLLVGQPQLKLKKELMLKSDKGELVARMMPEHIQFTGIRSAEEVEFVLDRYQRHSFFPRDSDISYVDWFAHDAVKRGWKLTDEAQLLWDAYVAARENLGLEEPHEMSMHALTTMVHLILIQYACRPGFSGLSDTDRSEIIDAVGFLSLESKQKRDSDEGGDDDDDDDE